MDVRRLGPGSATPPWVDDLDRACFGDIWGDLAEHETLWILEPWAFARWALMPAAGEAELVRIAVDASRRGEGLARRLLEAGQASLAREGFGLLHLEVRTGNGPARGLYDCCGWAVAGTRKGYYRDGEDAVLYQWLDLGK